MNIFKLLKGVKFDYGQIKKENVIRNWRFHFFVSDHLNSSPQFIPRFVGWVIKAFGRLHSKMTLITFIPPILDPITQYSTIIESIKQSQKLASASNMKFTHITADGGAAMKFFHVVWNNSD